MKWKDGIELNTRDIVIIAAAVVVLIVLCFFIPRFYPWRWFLLIFDMRFYQWWAWTIAGVVSVGTFLAIYLWPQRNRE